MWILTYLIALIFYFYEKYSRFIACFCKHLLWVSKIVFFSSLDVLKICAESVIQLHYGKLYLMHYTVANIMADIQNVSNEVNMFFCHSILSCIRC